VLLVAARRWVLAGNKTLNGAQAACNPFLKKLKMNLKVSKKWDKQSGCTQLWDLLVFKNQSKNHCILGSEK
jgi:hypothetical protein